MNLQQLYSKIRQAIDDYQMIEAGDKIAVGLSGGKDSVALLYALSGLQQFYPVPFSIMAVTVDLGFPGQDYSALSELCSQLNVSYEIIPTQIAEIVFDHHKEERPCSLCSRLRKGAFNQRIVELGCNKLAYAHHRDDVVDTVMLSLVYESRWHTLSPVTHLDKTGLSLIRPLIYVKEADIKGFIKDYQLPVHHNPCPADHHTRRETIKQMIHLIDKEAPGVRERLFTAICQSGIDGWLPR